MKAPDTLLFSWIEKMRKREFSENMKDGYRWKNLPEEGWIALPQKSFIRHKKYNIPLIRPELIGEVSFVNIYDEPLNDPSFFLEHDSLAILNTTELMEDVLLAKISNGMKVNLKELRFQSQEDSIRMAEESAKINTRKAGISEELYCLILAELYYSYHLYADAAEIYYYLINFGPDRSNTRNRWMYSVSAMNWTIER